MKRLTASLLRTVNLEDASLENIMWAVELKPWESLMLPRRRSIQPKSWATTQRKKRVGKWLDDGEAGAVNYELQKCDHMRIRYKKLKVIEKVYRLEGEGL